MGGDATIAVTNRSYNYLCKKQSSASPTAQPSAKITAASHTKKQTPKKQNFGDRTAKNARSGLPVLAPIGILIDPTCLGQKGVRGASACRIG